MEGMPTRAPLARSVMLGLCVMGLVGCGGGGGGGGNVRSDPPPAPSTPNPPVTTPPVTPPAPVTPAVPADAHLHAIGAAEVRRAGFAGNGATILFMDSGVNFAHPSLDDDTSWSSTWAGVPAPDTSVSDPNGHGTAVAQIAAGSWQGTFPGGVAPGNLFLGSLRMLEDKPSESGQTLTEDALTFLYSSTGTNAQTILNISTDALRLGAATPVYEGFADLSGTNGKDILTVVEAGNSAQAQPSALARLPFDSVDSRDLQSGWLVVGAVDSLAPTRLASYSNQCGVAKNSCLVAPGDVVVNGARDTAGAETYRTLHGTDYAAAQVSGAAALVWSAFPYFDNDLVRQTLLGSATDLGAPGVDEVYGYGLLNVNKAVWGPSRFDWGNVRVSLPDKAHSFWQNDISGSGGLTVGVDDPAAYATLWLSGDNTYTGKTVIERHGVLVIDGDMASPLEIQGTVSAFSGTWSGDVAIQPGGQLYFAVNVNKGAVVFTGDVRNDGYLTLDNTTNGVFKGDFSQGPSGRMGVYLGAPALKVAGTAQLGGYLDIFGVAPGYVAKARTELLVADGGLTGTFLGMSWPASLTLVANLGYDSTTAWLDVVRADMQVTATSLGLKATSVGSAQRIENAFDELDQRHGTEGGATAFEDGAARLQRIDTADRYGRAIDSLSGELHDMDAAFAMMAIDEGRRTLELRLDGLDAGGARGAWSQRLDATRGWSSFDVSTHGWMLGFDQAGRDGTTIGASLSQTDGDAWHSQRFDRERNRQIDVQVYASRDLGDGAYVLGSAGFGHMHRWLQREVLLGDETYRVSSDYAHRYGALSLQSGRRIPFGGSTITPYVGVQALQLERDGFSENGASGFGLTTNDASMLATQALAGARWSHEWLGASTRWALTGRIEWQHLLSQSGEILQARFTGMDAWAPIVADGLDRNVGLFGLGLEAGIGRRSTLRFDLDSRHAGAEQWTGTMATWTTAF